MHGYSLVQGLPHNNLPYPNHILMTPSNHQSHDLPQARDREPLLLLLQLQLLERIDPTCVITLRSKDDAVGAFFDVV